MRVVLWQLAEAASTEHATLWRNACLGPGRYGCRSGSFAAVLTTDDDGLVLDYEGAWRAVGGRGTTRGPAADAGAAARARAGPTETGRPGAGV